MCQGTYQVNKKALLEAVQSVTPRGINCIYIRQTEALGLGQTVRRAGQGLGDVDAVVPAVPGPGAVGGHLSWRRGRA